MEFKDFNKQLQTNFAVMAVAATHLFEVDFDKDKLWNLYLDSFPEGANPIFRERREFDCTCCRQFIRNFGGVVVIVGNQRHSIWDFSVEGTIYEPVLVAMSNYIRSCPIKGVYLTKDKSSGTQFNFDAEGNKWEHFYIQLPSKFVCSRHEELGKLGNEYVTGTAVFERSLSELSVSAVQVVRDLISRGQLYKGDEWKAVLEEFSELQTIYNAYSPADRTLFCWRTYPIKKGSITRLRNHSMGTLITDLTEGMDIEEAVRRYEAIVAPTNYKRPKEIFTQKMVDQLQKKLEELDLIKSVPRKFANLDDITINNLLFADRDVAKKLAGDMFSEMKASAVVKPVTFDKVAEVGIEDFIKNILPRAKSIEAYVESSHTANLVSLVAPQEKESKSMFKWDNNFSWAYRGNVTDSMKERVKAAGGNVEGVLRFSIQWNDGKDWDQTDLDAHCMEPTQNEIYYANATNRYTSGSLDVDIRHPLRDTPAVENIVWTDINKMPAGKYTMFVDVYARRSQTGFSAEIEFNGEIHCFNCDRDLRQGEKVKLANVYLSKDKEFTIESLLPSRRDTNSKEAWGVKTNQFVPVSACMFSPNYWDGNGVGNKHYMFMLKGCVSDEQPNGFFNEFLRGELMEHKRAVAALGSKMSLETVDNQLSGLGFSSTKRSHLICKVTGAITSVVKVLF